MHYISTHIIHIHRPSHLIILPAHPLTLIILHHPHFAHAPSSFSTLLGSLLPSLWLSYPQSMSSCRLFADLVPDERVLKY